MRKILTLIVFLFSASLMAQKEVYIPQQLYHEGYDASTTTNNLNVQWSRYRSRESENIVVFWANGYGNNDPNSLAVPEAFRVDIDDLLAKLESFYALNIHTLKFADLATNSNLNRYKMVICLFYTTDWMAYGSGFDDLIGGMWISPSTCHPVGSTIAHEIGHSFQYQVFCDLKGAAGFRYNFGLNGCMFWEATANWQAAMAYPDQMYSTSLWMYRQTHNLAFTHEWMRYESYWMHYYWCDKHGIDMIGRIWRGGTTWGDDVNQVYMKLHNMTSNDLYREYMDAAMHFVTWDFKNEDWKRRGSYFDIGNFVYNYTTVDVNKFQVSYSSCPQSTGYNVIPLEVPAAGTTVKTRFTALPPGCALAEGENPTYWNGEKFVPTDMKTYNNFAEAYARGFRLGYVALLRDGTRVYQTEDKVYCTGTDIASVDVSFKVPANTDRLWLVVSPAPTRYIMHGWDDNYTNDDQWPYQVEFTNTTIPGSDKYYLYDETTGLYFSRGGAGGTQNVADNFGFPLLDKTNLKATYKTNNRVVYQNTATGGYLKVNADKSIATDATLGTATIWKQLTSARRNEQIAEQLAKQEKEVGALANIGVDKQSLAQHAANDFKATDMTSNVVNAALSHNVNGWQVTGSTPVAIDNVMEVYENTTQLAQTVRRLPKGLYRVSLNAFYRNGFPDACVANANAGFKQMSNAYIEANGRITQIADWAGQRKTDIYPNWPNESNTCFNEGLYRNDLYTFVGDDGLLDIKIVSPSMVSGGWFCFSDLTLTYYGMNNEFTPEYVEIAADTPPIAARSVATGAYYLRNRASGTFLTAGGERDAQAVLAENGLNFTLRHIAKGQYTFNSRIESATNCSFIGNLGAVGAVPFVDQEEFNYAIQPLSNGAYVISYQGVSSDGHTKTFYWGYDESKPDVLYTRLTDSTDVAAQWDIIKRADYVELLQEKARQATPDNPVDVTGYLHAADFIHNDTRNATSWKGDPFVGGNVENNCAEKFNTSFNVYQTVTKLLPGLYRVEAQGFHRYGSYTAAYTAFSDGTENIDAVMYANDVKQPLKSIFADAKMSGFPGGGTGSWAEPAAGYTIPDDMSSASTAFSAGFYKNELLVEVGDNGILNIGFKKTSGATPEANWTAFDNVRLYALQIDEEDAIEDILTDDEKSATDKRFGTAVYDLSGRRVADKPTSSLPRGIYIIGGKKVVIR